MHGLILRTIQVYAQDTYGTARWAAIADRAHLEEPDFEAMLTYAEDVLDQVLAAASAVLEKPRDAFLEDLGTYLVSHPNSEALRRLLRFGGVDFLEFLYSLDDLPDRARLAVPDLDLPDLELRDAGQHMHELTVTGPLPGFGHVIVGVLRAMADDYGALALLEHKGRAEETETIAIALIETAYAEGREFDLGAGAGHVS